MTADEVLAAADRNMVGLWTGLVEAAGGSVERRPGLVLLSTGLPIAMFNPAFVTGPLRDASSAVDEVQAWARSRGVPFALYFRDATAPGLASACRAAGLVEHWQPPLMVLDPIVPAPTPDELTVEVVDPEAYGDYLAALCRGFGIPLAAMAPVLGPETLGVPGFTGVLARVDGTPVAGSAVFVTGPVAGVYNVATAPEHRGRGYGAAVTAEAARLGASAGATRAVLQASEAGQPVYERLGYAVADRYRQFEPAP